MSLMFAKITLLISMIISLKADEQIQNIQCAQEHDLDLKLFPECQLENSCIITDLRIDENSSAYEVNRAQIHEFQCLIFMESFMQKIPSNIFVAARSKITHLYANNVSISELSRNSFLIVNQLKSVDLSWNALQGLFETAFYDASNLIELNLSHNKIAEFSPSVFERLDRLTILDLSFNQITSIPFELFQPLRRLTTLNLRENRLQLKFGIFPESVSSLDLSYNNLEFQQKFKIFALLENLETFLLHGNRIESIHPSIFEAKNVKFLGLSRNLFSCNALADIILNMKAHNIKSKVENVAKNTSNINGIQCIE